MKAFFHKIVTEKPRAGGRYDYHDHRVRYKGMDIEKLDDLPKHQGYRRPYGYDSKNFSDLLGPLEGFLRSRVGHKWDDVYSEIRERINPSSTVQLHIMNHVFGFIYAKTLFGDDGHIYSVDGGGFRGGSPFRVGYGDLYVHPTTGIICAMPERKRYYDPEYSKAVKRLRYVFGNDWHGVLGAERKNRYGYAIGHRHTDIIDESKKHIRLGFEKELHQINGIWYWAIFADVPPPFTQSWFDSISQETKSRTIARTGTDYWTKKTHTEGRYRSDKRQANRRDLRRHGVKNSG